MSTEENSLEAELRNGRELAERLVDHIQKMRAGRLCLQVMRATADGECVTFSVVVMNEAAVKKIAGA